MTSGLRFKPGIPELEALYTMMFGDIYSVYLEIQSWNTTVCNCHQ